MKISISEPFPRRDGLTDLFSLSPDDWPPTFLSPIMPHAPPRHLDTNPDHEKNGFPVYRTGCCRPKHTQLDPNV